MHAKSKYVQCDGKDLPIIHSDDTQSLQRHRFVIPVRKLPSVFDKSAARSIIFVAIVLVVAHLALLVGVTTPEKFYFDEVHYVPAARQMLEPVLPSPLLNPMHPPLAKELMAVSIRVFGDVPLGWRYPSVLFGSLAIVAMYLCGLALFTAQGPAVRLLQPDGVRAVADRDAGYFRARVQPVGDRSIHLWLSETAAARLVCSRRAGFRSFDRLQMERTVCAGDLYRHRRRDPPDAKLAVCRLCAEARQQPALAVMGFRRNRLRGFCGDAADLGCVRGNVDGDLQPADDFSELDLRDSARRRKVALI
jgi:hypothetical protein